MSVPAVSVIVNFLDQKAFIRESLDSVLAQTFQDWELLLIDDGSNDGSTEIAQQYARAFPAKIRYFEHAGHENRGISASGNVGLRAARAAYVAFLDADDVWLPSKLQDQVPLLDRYPDAVMLYGDTTYWYSWTGRDEDAQRDTCVPAGVPRGTLVDPPTLFVRMLRQEFPIPCPSDILLRRHLALEVGGFEEFSSDLHRPGVVFKAVFTLGRLRCCGQQVVQVSKTPEFFGGPGQGHRSIANSSTRLPELARGICPRSRFRTCHPEGGACGAVEMRVPEVVERGVPNGDSRG